MTKLPKKTTPTKHFTYKEQHAVIVIADSEAEQKKLFESLKAAGHKQLKIVSV